MGAGSGSAFTPPDQLRNNGARSFLYMVPGYLQNVTNGGVPTLENTMFHNYDGHGYTVLEMWIMRGSAGYGRDWRTGIYRTYGRQNRFSDQVDGAKFLVNSQGVDAETNRYLLVEVMVDFIYPWWVYLPTPEVFKSGASFFDLSGLIGRIFTIMAITANILNTPDDPILLP